MRNITTNAISRTYEFQSNFSRINESKVLLIR